MHVVGGDGLVSREAEGDEGRFAAAAAFYDVEGGGVFAPHGKVGLAVAVVVVLDGRVRFGDAEVFRDQSAVRAAEDVPEYGVRRRAAACDRSVGLAVAVVVARHDQIAADAP